MLNGAWRGGQSFAGLRNERIIMIFINFSVTIRCLLTFAIIIFGVYPETGIWTSISISGLFIGNELFVCLFKHHIKGKSL